MSDFDERMRPLRDRFVTRCGERREQLADALGAGDTEAIVRIAHELAGTGGLFGFPDLSRAARDLEDAVRAGDRGGGDWRGAGDALLQALGEQSTSPLP